MSKCKLNFWYLDNWTGRRREFATAVAAIKAAEQESGVTIHIYRANGRFYRSVKASGHTPS